MSLPWLAARALGRESARRLAANSFPDAIIAVKLQPHAKQLPRVPTGEACAAGVPVAGAAAHSRNVYRRSGMNAGNLEMQENPPPPARRLHDLQLH